MAIHKLYTKNRKTEQPNFISPDYPAIMKAWPDILLAGAGTNAGGAARLWHLAKSINRGCGVIPAKALRKYISFLGIKQPRYNRWLDHAFQLGLLEKNDRNIKIASIAKTAHILGVDHLSGAVQLKPVMLVKKGWTSWAWAGWLKIRNFTDRPISRATLRKLSGICERHQLELEKKSRVFNRHNYAIDYNRGADQLAGIRDYERQDAFVYQGHIAWRLPNSKEIKNIQVSKKGATRRNNNQLAALKGRAIKTQRDPFIRIYNDTDKQFKQSLKTIRRLSGKGHDNLPNTLYCLESVVYGNGEYAVIGV